MSFGLESQYEYKIWFSTPVGVVVFHDRKCCLYCCVYSFASGSVLLPLENRSCLYCKSFASICAIGNIPIHSLNQGHFLFSVGALQTSPKQLGSFVSLGYPLLEQEMMSLALCVIISCVTSNV